VSGTADPGLLVFIALATIVACRKHCNGYFKSTDAPAELSFGNFAD
jgi:hypothetical protein